jgi:hypothetical protein
MPEAEIIPEEMKARIGEIGRADLVIGLPAVNGSGALAGAALKAGEALRMVSPNLVAVLVHCDGAAAPAAEPDGRLRLLRFPRAPESDPLSPPGRSASRRRRTLLAVSLLLEARACGVLESDPEKITAPNLSRLIEPILGQDQDLAVACYWRRKFDNLLNTAIVYPLLRALYGKRVQWPMAPDFAASPRLVRQLLASRPLTRSQTPEISQASIVTDAIRGGFQICQSCLQTRLESPVTEEDLSGILTNLLRPMFLDIERDAPFWQRLRGSQPVPTFGELASPREQSPSVDVSRMVESYQLGFRNLQEVWSLVLSPATIVGMKKITRLSTEQFRVPDALWVRVVYDFVLAFRLRVINRDHLLRALTPAYLAWVASYALEVKDAGEAEVEARVERLCSVFEAEKPYFQSRWRWPDRFNP